MQLSDNLLRPGFKNISRKGDDYSVGKQKNFTETGKKQTVQIPKVHNILVF